MSWSQHRIDSTERNRRGRSSARAANRRQARLETLESRNLLAADLVSLSPADDAVTVADANLVLTFSEDVQSGPGTGNLFIHNANDGSLVEAINIASDRVTFDGSSVTIDPVNDLPNNTNFYVQIDNAAIRDTSSDVVNTALLTEDFEGLSLRDSDLANDDEVLDIDDYVLVMSGTLDVQVAGEYTFGGNSDDGQQLSIDVAQDGLDLIDDEIIFDNTTHGNQDRLSVCGSDFAGQNCVDSGDDAITLDVGEYAFEYWYFERGGGSSGEFFYAPGKHETFDPAAFVLVGDDSQGIGVTADGITATTYKAATDEITDLNVSFDLVDQFLDNAPGFPASETIPTADVYNTGGTGRFPDNHPLPGFPPPVPGDDLDWTDEGPFGWTRDNSQLPEGGRPEYNGWVFLDKHFWINEQDNQGRVDFMRGEGTVALVDPDAFDDFLDIGDGAPPSSTFNASLSSPVISLTDVAANSATVSFDSSWRDEDFQTAELRVEYFDADGNSLSENVVFTWESQAGPNFKDDAANEAVEGLALDNPANAASMVITWSMPVAGNDWWWAIDNVVVGGDMTGNPFPGFSDVTSWNFNTFSAPTISFDPAEASVAEDGGEVSLTLIREGDASVPVSVSYATGPGTARAGDFAAASGTVDFAADETEKTIVVGINEDTASEADETFTVTLSSPTGGAAIGAGTATVTIIDNDRPVIVFQQEVETTINGEGTGATYMGTTDADPREASPDEFRDRDQLNPDGEDGGGEIHGLTAFKDLFGDGPGQIPADAIITSATLTLNITNEGSSLRVHRLLGDFNEEEVTWNDLMLNGNTEPGLQGDGVEATPPLREFSAPAAVVDVDVTEDLQVWLSGEAENFGWGFTPTGTNGVDWDSSEAADPAARPKLSVEYVVVEFEPSPLPDVTSPGDELVRVDGENDGDANDGPPPENETVEHVIDDVTQKHLNFLDLGSGFIVTPSAGASVVSGLRLYTANDAVERDPASYVLEGGLADGPFTLISEGDLALPDGRNEGGDIPIDTSLFFQEILFNNTVEYTSYRLTFPTLKDVEAANSMQIAEVEFLGEIVAPPSLPGDIDGDGTVGFPDFLILSANFGQMVDPGTNGDIDGDGNVAFPDFLVLSANFGQSVAPVAALVDAALADLAGGEDSDDESDDLGDLLDLL